MPTHEREQRHLDAPNRKCIPHAHLPVVLERDQSHVRANSKEESLGSATVTALAFLGGLIVVVVGFLILEHGWPWGKK